jgi:archaeal cell division control protein 6
MNGSVFINPEALEHSFLPRLLPYREGQHKYLADCLKPLFENRNGTNIVIAGEPGIGKTACVRFILRKLREEAEPIMPIYVNCWKKDTTPKIIAEMANLLDIKTLSFERVTTDEMFDKIIAKLNKYNGVVFAFDEVDKAKDYDFLYRLLEDVSRKTMYLITNVSDWSAKLDRRLTSRMLLDSVDFKAYTFEETRGILREREKYAFVPNVWNYDAFETLIRETFKARDIRTGLFLMKRSGEIADNRGAEKIETRDVEGAIKKVKEVPTELGSFV